MASNNSPKAKLDTSRQPRPLTPSEIDSLRREMQSASEWMQAELERQNQEKPPLE